MPSLRARRSVRYMLGISALAASMSLTALPLRPTGALAAPAAKTRIATDSSSSVLRTFAPVFMGRSWNLTQAQAIAIAQQTNLIVAQAYVFKPYVSAMKTANPDLKILAYVDGTYDMSPTGNTYPASWYAVDSSGQRIKSVNFGLYLMDVSNPLWATTVAQECTTMLATSAYDGCLVDSLGTAPFFPGYDSGLPYDAATGAVWDETAWMQLTTVIASAVQSLNPTMPVIANGVADGIQYFSTTAVSSVILGPTHLGMAQLFMRPQNGAITTFRSVAKWQEDVDMLVDAESHGNSVVAITQLFVPATVLQRAQWHKFALASFLLGAGGLSYFSFLGANNDPTITTYNPWDHVNIGTPLGHYTQSGSIYERAFTNGIVAVNPTTTSATLTLSGTYTTLNGTVVTGSYTMPAHTGDVLLAG